MACKLNSRNNKIRTSKVLSGCMKYQFPATPFSQIPPVSFLLLFFLSLSKPSLLLLSDFSQTPLRLLSNSYFLSFFSSFPVLSLFSSKPLPFLFRICTSSQPPDFLLSDSFFLADPFLPLQDFPSLHFPMPNSSKLALTSFPPSSSFHAAY